MLVRELRKKMKRFFDEEFKANAIKLLESGLSASEVCKELQITPKQLRRWETQHKAHLLDVALERVKYLEAKVETLNSKIRMLKSELKGQNR